MSIKIKSYTVINKLIFFLIIIFFLIPNVYAVNIDSNEISTEPKHVLLICSYSPSFQSFFPQVDGVKSQFDGQNILLDIEFMDAKRFYTEDNMNYFYENLKYKLSCLPAYDGVIVADDDAFNFAVKYQNDLFKDIPVVFFGVNNTENAVESSKNPYITGIVEVPSFSGTIEMALELNKKATGVIAIVDGTTTGQAELELLNKDMENFKNIPLTVLNLEDLTFDEMLSKVSKINNDKIILLLSPYRDKTGQVYTIDESIDALLNYATQPLYYPYYEALSYKGLLGGKVISHYEHASVAAGILLDVFSGKDISTIPCMLESPTQYVVNYDVLKKFGLDENQLPQNTIFLNKKISFAERYFRYVFVVVLTVLFLLIIIITLKMKNTKIKRAESELIRKKEDLTAVNDELTVIKKDLIVALQEIREQDEQIQDLIYKDSLTGINNRFSLFQLIDEALENKKSDELLSLIFLDIDNFKNINDICGHDVGDKVIRIVGDRLKKFENNNISLGRFGGDEFIFLINRAKTVEEIKVFVNKIKKSVEQNISVELNRFNLAVSIGVSLGDENNNTRTNLLKKADFALYEAKNSGKNKFVFYSNTMEKDLEEKVKLQSAIKEAIKNNEFYLKYQPSVSTYTHEIRGFEALLRWSRKDFKDVSAYELIKNIEEMGLINDVGKWVLREACQFTKKINATIKKPLKVSVNVSAIQLMCTDFFDSTMQIINESQLDTKYIYLEMTETILIKSLESSKNIIEKLKEAGIGVALDDFGTGYSSLTYFKDLPVSLLKIDKSFVDHIVESKYDQNLISFMINIAHNRNVRVTAEGVECQNQLELLEGYGCDTIQGFLFSKPLNEEELLKFIEDNNTICANNSN